MKLRQRIFTLNEPAAPRLNPALACEIGLNESLLLLQLEFWISISDNERDGKQWTYQSTRDIQNKAFPFWSVMTINRGIKSLIKQGLIESTTKYNKARYDKTRWFTLVPENINKLSSVRIDGYVTRSSQNDTGSSQNDTALIYTENTTENTTTTETGCCCSSNQNSKSQGSMPKKVGEGKTSTDKKNELQELLSLIPESLHSPMLINLIEAALRSHESLFLRECILYALENSNRGIKAFNSFLGLTIKNGWAAGFLQTQEQDIDHQRQRQKIQEQEILKSRREMPTEILKLDAARGCQVSAQVLKERNQQIPGSAIF